MHDTLIVGAGMAGLACAMKLAAAGQSVLCLDKGRGPGGRMATRRAENQGEEMRFDHGAQYFTARDPAFRAQVRAWHHDGVCAPWPAAGEDAWVGTPGMNEPVRAMAAGLAVQWAERVESLHATTEGWEARTATESYRARSIVVAVPPEQAGSLIAPHQPAFAARALETPSKPCWAVMAQFSAPLPFDDVLREREAIAWAARDSAKPGRAPGERWVLHASHDWSDRHRELDPEKVTSRLLDLFLEPLAQPPVVQYAAAHRWLYALAQPLAGPPAMWDVSRRIGVAGDWLIAPRVESAWLSGTNLAERMLA